MLTPQKAYALHSRAPRTIVGHQGDCEDPMYAKQTLKVVDEYPIARMVFENGRFDGARGLRKFEASDVAVVPGSGNPFYVVLDNSFKILEVDPRFGVEERTKNALLGWPGDDGSDSQFEVLAYNISSKAFVAVQEMIEHDDGKLHAKMFDVVFDGGKTVVKGECHSEYEFSKENKGFEGGVIMNAKDGTSYLLSLCEGNHCAGGKKGRDSGHGRLVVQKRTDKDGKCVFETVGMIKLPDQVDFMDYSAITLNQNSSGPGGEMRVAVASQENSAIWISSIFPSDDGLFKFSDGKIYDFPRDSNCKPIYCNVEGLAFGMPMKTRRRIFGVMLAEDVCRYGCG